MQDPIAETTRNTQVAFHLVNVQSLELACRRPSLRHKTKQEPKLQQVRCTVLRSSILRHGETESEFVRVASAYHSSR